MTPRRRTRKSTTHWLIGTEDDKILGGKLPRTRQVLRFFFHQHYTLRRTIRESARAAVREALRFWERALIPTAEVKNIVVKLEKNPHGVEKSPKKSREGTSPSFTAQTTSFTERLDELFDIAHKDALKLIKISEDVEFLMAQREKRRRGCMLRKDMKLARKQVRKLKRLEAIQRQQSREEEVRKHRLRAVSSVDESESFNVGDGENSDDSDFEVNERNIRVPKTRRVISNDYLAMLDRSKMSVRYAAAVSLTLLGDDAGTSVMSKSTIHRERVKFRQESQKDEELIRGHFWSLYNDLVIFLAK